MKFKMNNRDWEIIELSQEEIRDHYIEYKYDGEPTEGKYFGLTYSDTQKIYIDKDLCKGQKKQTLYHELMHCYIESYITMNIENINEELLCDISANSHDIIHKIAEDYFKLQPATFEIEMPEIKIEYYKDIKEENDSIDLNEMKKDVETMKEIQIKELREKIKKIEDDMVHTKIIYGMPSIHI